VVSCDHVQGLRLEKLSLLVEDCTKTPLRSSWARSTLSISSDRGIRIKNIVHSPEENTEVNLDG
jgi:hypothetical protein